MSTKRLALIGIAGLIVLAGIGFAAFNLLFTNNTAPSGALTAIPVVVNTAVPSTATSQPVTTAAGTSAAAGTNAAADPTTAPTAASGVATTVAATPASTIAAASTPPPPAWPYTRSFPNSPKYPSQSPRS